MPTTKKSKRSTPKSSPVEKSTSKQAEENVEVQETTQPTRKSGTNNLLVVLLIIISLFAGYNFAKVKGLEGTGGAAAAPTAAPQGAGAQPTRELKIKKPDLSKEHVRGNKNARYVWVDYSDLECPFCKQIHPNLIKLTQENKDIAWVFRHYPLPFHPKAEPAAEAVECANELGGSDAFWKLNDMIYEKMPDLEVSTFPDLAGQIGLDQAAFTQCTSSKKYEQAIKDSVTEGTNAGVQATPTGVIYDMKTGKSKLVEGAVPYEQIKSELESFIAANK